MLYQLASNPTAYQASFTDVRAGSNDTYGISNGKVFAATRGYDPATGLGSPRLTGSAGTAGLAYYLCSLTGARSRPAVTGLTPASGSAAGGERVRIAGSGFMAHGRSLVASIQIGARPLPAGNLADPQRPHDPRHAPRPPARGCRPTRTCQVTAPGRHR